MLILHNCLDAVSQDFLVSVLGSLPDHDLFVNGKMTVGAHTIYCWYHGGQEAFWSESGTKEVSAFPSVVVDVPEHDLPIPPISSRTTPETFPAHQHVIRLPTNILDVNTFIDEVNEKLALSESVRRTVPLLKRQEG